MPGQNPDWMLPGGRSGQRTTTWHQDGYGYAIHKEEAPLEGIRRRLRIQAGVARTFSGHQAHFEAALFVGQRMAPRRQDALRPSVAQQETILAIGHGAFGSVLVDVGGVGLVIPWAHGMPRMVRVGELA